LYSIAEVPEPIAEPSIPLIQCGYSSFPCVDTILYHLRHYSASGLPHRPHHRLVQLT